MPNPAGFPIEGGCDCRHVRYRIETAPLFVHCCHCRWCQRESGASFALNAMIESERVALLAGAIDLVDTPSESGRGQRIARCPRCRIALWSHYSGAGPAVKFVRVGTLDHPDLLAPDIHIFTQSRQPWIVLAPGVPAVPEYYDRAHYWPADSLARREALLARSTAAAAQPDNAAAALRIERDDLSRPAVHALLQEHLDNMFELSPPESVHALDLEKLRQPDITFWTAWQGAELVGCGALKQLSASHGEVKSMRTPQALRRRGAGRAVLTHIVAEARLRGLRRLSLETGSQPEFEPAQNLYRSFGFSTCGPFADYQPDPYSVFMTLQLEEEPSETPARAPA